MNPIQIIATLRKFGNFIAGLFPWLVTMVDAITSFIMKFLKHPKVAAVLEKISKNRFFKPLWDFFERFYWRTYAKDRLDLKQAPAAVESTLRSLFRLSAILCIAIPFSGISSWPIPIDALSFQGTAPAWAVLVWIYALPRAWAALLVGCAKSNRGIFLVVAIAATYFLTTCVLGLPRSVFNALLSTSIFFALFCSERHLKTQGKLNLGLGIANSIIVGSAVGVQLIALTPLKPLLNTLLHDTNPNLTIISGTILGSILGLIVFAWARLAENPTSPYLFRGAQISINRSISIISLLLGAYLVAGLCRGNLKETGTWILSSLNLSNNYLWPLWYFIGVGIMYKLIGSTKVIAGSFEGVLTKKILGPCICILLIASLVITFNPRYAWTFIASFASSSDPSIQFLVVAYAFLTHLCASIIWNNPLNAMAVNWFNWVLIVDAVIVATLAIQRRLSSTKLMRLFFLNVLAALLVWEYVFQLSSFARTPTDSLLVIFLFSIWLLWLLHTVASGICSISTRKWPSEGRFTIFGAVVTLVILQIFARASCKDFKLMNEFFLTMFRGVIDFGPPYYLLMWSSKRLERIPSSMPSMLGHFVCGAVAALFFNALEKFAVAGWSFEKLKIITENQTKLLESVGNANLDANIPAEFFVQRSVLFVALLAVITFVARRTYGKEVKANHTIFFCLISFASGVAAFSNSLMELPIPATLRALTAPATQELTFNCSVIQTFLSFWLPTLAVALAMVSSKRGSLRSLCWSLPLACACGAAISAGYSKFEVFFRATGAIYPLTVAFVGVLFILLQRSLSVLKSTDNAIEQIESSSTEASTKIAIAALPSTVSPVPDLVIPDSTIRDPAIPDPSGTYLAIKDSVASDKSALDSISPDPKIAEEVLPDTELKEPILTARSTLALLVALELVLVPIALSRLNCSTKRIQVKAIGRPISMLSKWTPIEQTNKSTDYSKFKKINSNGTTSLLQIGEVESDPQGTAALMKELLKKGVESGQYNKLVILSVQSWNKYAPSAIACSFTAIDAGGTPALPGHTAADKARASMPISGLCVLLPSSSENKTTHFTLYSDAENIEKETWEIANAVAN